MAKVENIDQSFMKIALKEAVKATGRTTPNPLVGAVIVKDGRIISKGYHKKAGTPHAEINALSTAGVECKGATIYVTLEPCNHHGRTPPCTEAILASGIKKVVVGMADPNPGVTGAGSDYLKQHGLEVIRGVLRQDCYDINRPFAKWITTGLPWVVMKAGLTLDGKIAARTGNSGWITNDKSRRYVHQLRDQVDAILVGIGTVLNDDPALTTRLPKKKCRDPLRVIIDTRLRFPHSAKMLSQDSNAATLIFCGTNFDRKHKIALEGSGAEVVVLEVGADGRLNLKHLLKELGTRQVCSILVEGGSAIHASFLKADLYDQAYLFYGTAILGGDGIPLAGDLGHTQVGQARRLTDITTRRFGDDIMVKGYF